jgi:hypothetical protein
MYETPKLNRVGDAQDVILGVIQNGDDLDGTRFIEDMEWADDGDSPQA